VVSNLEVPLLLDEDYDGVPDGDTSGFAEGYVYQLEGDSWMYVWNGAAGEEVTGLHIADQVTLTLLPHSDGTAYLRMPQITNEGTLTATPNTSQVRNLDLRGDRYHGTPTSTIDASAPTDDTDGGTLYLYANYVFFNEGTIAANGLGTGAGGSVEWEADRLRNLGDVSVDGGTASSGAGGAGGSLSLWTFYDLYNSGDLTARGGGGPLGGGKGGGVRLEAESSDVRNSGDIDASGGGADLTCTTGCVGGNAQRPTEGDETARAVVLRSTGGAVVNSGAITATGGFGGADGNGGNGGYVEFTTINWERAAGGVEVSGTLDTSGGEGVSGGSGGRIFAQVFSDTPTDAELIFYGYTKITLDAGDGAGDDGEGGEGGEVLIKNNCPAESYLPPGGVLNFVDISSVGGDGAADSAGRAGKVQVNTCKDMGSNHQGGSVIVNAGDITLTGGSGTSGDYGGQVELRAHEWAENSGVILTGGGNGSSGSGASPGDVKLEALAGQVINTGPVTGAGGSATSTDGDGKQGSTIELVGLLVDNTADLTAPGGAGGATSGLGGNGGYIRLDSRDGLSANSGSFDISVGTGGGGDGNPGRVIIDGMDHTEDWTP